MQPRKTNKQRRQQQQQQQVVDINEWRRREILRVVVKIAREFAQDAETKLTKEGVMK